ncbi:MAG: efflux RND transporter permease subunit [Polyangiaceae bacterium]|nr:efflux RND transporter permease subunit [Polyangiaceae bacterium]
MITLLIAGIVGSQLPKLKVDTSPGNLVANLEGHSETEAAFESYFGGSGPQLFVVIESGDILSAESLDYQVELERSLEKLESVGAVHSLISLALAVPVSEEFEAEDPISPEEKQARELATLMETKVSELTPRERAQQAALKRRGVPILTHRELDEKKRKAKEAALDEAFEEAGPGFPSRSTWEEIARAEDKLLPDGIFSLMKKASKQDSSPPRSYLESKNAAEFRAAVAENTWLVPTLLSQDNRATSLVVQLDPKKVVDQKTRLAAVAAVRECISGITPPSGVQATLGGVPVIREAIQDKLKEDRRVLNPLMGIVCLLILGLTFRWWPAVVAPISAVLLTAITVLGGMAILRQPLTILTNIITPLLLIVGLSDSVHLLGRYREELEFTSARQLAGRRAVRAMMSACFLTSLPTAFGFASLAIAKTPELRSFGLTAAAGVLLAYLATVFFVPAFVTLMKAPPSEKQEGRAGRLERGVAVLTRWVVLHAGGVGAGTVVLAGVLGWATFHIRADARLLDAFDEEDPIHQVTMVLQEKLSGVRPMELMLSSDAGIWTPENVEAVDQFATWAEQQPGVLAVRTFTTPVHLIRKHLVGASGREENSFRDSAHLQAYTQILRSGSGKALEQQVTADDQHARMTIFLEDVGVRRSLGLIDEMEAKAQALFPKSLGFALTGEAYIGTRGRSYVLRDLLGGLVLALITIFGLLSVLFRSVRFGLVAVPPNVIPLLGTGAYMMLRGIELNLTTVITFSIGIGLAVDDTIHVVARFREEQKRVSSVNVALIRAARGTGRAIVVTAISLSLGFGVLLLSHFVSVRQFAELIIITVVNCLLGALVIQPALLKLACAPARFRRSEGSSRPAQGGTP